MTLYRTFIAVELSDESRRLVAEIQERLRTAGAALRWVRPENLHYTLSFLGEIPAAQVARAVVATRNAAGRIVPFQVYIGGLGAFPSLERPQVVWVGCTEGAEALGRLAGEVKAALDRERLPSDPKPFRPHLTLGRAKDNRQWGDLVRAVRAHRDSAVGQEWVRAVTVMESRLTPDGPIYTPREKVLLGHGLNSTGT
ncbi:MAG: RNA 2',3'-cyclic phosphodiesterase [Armatimonadetes bacterium]|nr:RNA 2',3'-cyclic phosphodiesterase [Armatimonadota bacterium]